MFPSKILQRMRHGAPARRPVAAACVASPSLDLLAPLPLPEVLEDNSDAAWQQWLAANDAHDPVQTLRMELRPED